MSIAIADIKTSDEHQVSLVIDGGPVLTKQYGSRSYRVTSLVITYRRRNVDPWKPTNVDLCGPYVKKDGSDGVDRNCDVLYGQRSWPDWVLELVNRYTPGGVQ